MTRKDPALTILQISDTHLHAAADSRMRGVTTYATFLAVLEHAQRDPRWPVDAILATGDIVQDESRAGYERFRAALEPLGVPVYSIPGNHDDPKLMGEILTSGSFQLGGELRHGAWSIVLLSTFLAGEDAGGLGPARLQGLRQALAAHSGQHVLVAMHHHPLPMGSTWLDGVALRDAHGVLEPHRRAPGRPRRRLRPRPSSRRPDAQPRAVLEHAVDVRAVPAGQRVLRARRPPARHALDRAPRRRPHRNRGRWVVGART